MYCDELPEKYNEIAATYELSDKYKVVGLCEKLLALCESALSIENALIIYDQLLSMESRIPTGQFGRLSLLVLDILKMHTFLAFQSSSFTQIREETLIQLLNADFLFMKEIEIFDAAVRWVAAADGKSIADKRTTLRSIKQLIRFPLMSESQFYRAVELSRKIFTGIDEQLFTEQELAEFAKYYKTENLEELKTVVYDAEPRRGSMVVKLDYDYERVSSVSFERFLF